MGLLTNFLLMFGNVRFKPSRQVYTARMKLPTKVFTLDYQFRSQNFIFHLKNLNTSLHNCPNLTSKKGLIAPTSVSAVSGLYLQTFQVLTYLLW